MTISTPSTPPDSAEPLTYAQAEFLVSPSVSPGSDEAMRMTVRSGQKCAALLRSAGPVPSWLRTCMASSAWRSTICLLTWTPSATARGRLLFRLRASVPRIAATGSGSSAIWPTPRASPNENRQTKPTPSQMNGTHGLSLAAEVNRRFLPTPRTEGFDAGGHRGTPDSLHSHVKLFPTPMQADGMRGSDTYMRGNPTLRGAAGGKLSADWVEALMMYPPGWTEVRSEASPAPSPSSPTAPPG